MIQNNYNTTVRLKNGDELSGIYRAKTSSINKVPEEFYADDVVLQSLYENEDYKTITVFRMEDVASVTFSASTGDYDEEEE